MRRIVPCAALALAAPSLAVAQTSVHGGLELGRAEHRVIDQGALVAASGTVFGGTVTLALHNRFEIQGRALGGKLVTASTPSLEDHSLAEVQLLGAMKVAPWVTVQTGLGVRNFSNSLARQHWTTWLVGAEALVPLGFDGVTAALRGSWMPLVAVSGLSSPGVALGAGVGLEWRGHVWGAGALYAFERYDFPPQNGMRRLEEVGQLRVRVMTWWPRARHAATAPLDAAKTP